MGCCGSKHPSYRCGNGHDELEALVDPQVDDDVSCDPRRTNGARRLYIVAGCIATALAAIIGFYYVLVSIVTGQGEQDFLLINEEGVNAFCTPGLTMANLPSHSRWPGCGDVRDLSDFEACAEPCYSKHFIRSIEEFSAKYPGQLVTYESRRNPFLKTVKLTGWWLPAPGTKKGNSSKEEPATRVVVQHTIGENSNTFRTQLTAYMLRSLGFSVLLNNLRDHCYSEDSSNHLIGWGHSYPFDVLGAWDYARSDPDGQLGGPLPAGQVGIMGFSSGAYITAIALGLESKVPAAWLDSAPLRPKSTFMDRELFGLGPLAGPVLNQAWSNLEGRAEDRGVLFNQHLPEEVLPQGPDTRRHVGWVHNKQDAMVSFSEGEKLVKLLESLPQKYEVMKFETEGDCNGETHAVDNLRLFNEYAARLCSFWTQAFDLASSGCVGQ